MRLPDYSFAENVGDQHDSARTSRSRFVLTRFATVALVLAFSAPGCALLAEPPVRPVIHTLSKVDADNDEYVIQGSNFTNADHGTVIKDTGDAVTLLQNGQISSLPPEKLWDKHGSPWAKGLERTQSESNGRAHYQARGKSYNGYLKPLENSGNTKLFVSWRLKLSESPGHAKGSNKFIRVWDKTDGKGTRISWTQMHMTYSGSKKPSWGGWPGKRDQWNQMTFWVDSEQGLIQARVNGKLSHNVQDFKKVDADKGLNIKLIGFDPNRSTPYKDIEVGIDELYVSSTQARVVISDEATWAEAQNRQSVQIPTAWRPDKIRFVYQPADYLRVQRYLYVVDKHGAANMKGFPLAKAGPQQNPN